MGLKLKCPACGGQDWKLIGDFILPIAVKKDGSIADCALARPLKCGGCGYLAMFAAQPAGPVED